MSYVDGFTDDKALRLASAIRHLEEGGELSELDDAHQKDIAELLAYESDARERAEAAREAPEGGVAPWAEVQAAWAEIDEAAEENGNE